MPRKRWIEKNKATTYQLLYRSQNDPLLHDDDAGDRALFQTSGPNVPSSSSNKTSQKQGLHITDLEDDVDLESMRDNEGEAAGYGIYYDDTKYDYMQHLRDVGDGEEDSHFIDSIPVKTTGKGKGKQKAVRLEDALRAVSLDDDRTSTHQGGSILGDEFSSFSKSERQRTYQDQQEVPDDIAGFQPDMDPRLREVLEALEDDAYVDDKDEEDIFGALGREGRNGELSMGEFEVESFDDDDGWESDATEKAPVQLKELKMPDEFSQAMTADAATGQTFSSSDEILDAVAEDGDWLRDFAKYKRDAKRLPPKAADSIIAGSAVQDKAPTLYTLNGTPLRRKKRAGAQTNPSAYSMTSSSLSRTEGLQLLDARFDQVERMYSLDEMDEFDDLDGGMSLTSGRTGMTGMSKMSKMSKVSQVSTTSFTDTDAVPDGFDNMMDDFLGDWNKANPGGKRKGAKGKRGKNGNEVYGLQQLEEVRRELGPARIHNRTQKA